jgi:hypothetical protein
MDQGWELTLVRLANCGDKVSNFAQTPLSAKGYLPSCNRWVHSNFPKTKSLLTINIFADNGSLFRTPKRPPALGQFDFNAAKKVAGHSYSRT